MKRFLLALALTLGLMVPAQAVEILTLPITTATSALVGSTFQFRSGPVAATNMSLQATFTYGSGGTSADAWVQTSLDGGTTWSDVAHFNFTTASARTIMNVAANTPALATITPGDGGALAVNTALSGVWGNMWRVKYTTVGTYAGNTKLLIDAIAVGLTPQ